MECKNSKLLKFVTQAKELCKDIPQYSSKYSNKIFSNHDHIILLVLKQKLRTTYKDLIELLQVSWVTKHIGLSRIPHYTTLIKFSKRIKCSIIDYLLNIKKAKKTAIDSSGFEFGSRSYYYANRWNSDRKWPVKRHMKLSIAVDVDTQLILSEKMRLGPRNDNIDFKNVLQGLEVDYVLADKGYDSKENRKFVLRKLKAIPHIPCRSNSKIKRYVPKFNKKIYNQRSKVETIFSVIKRKYGSRLRARALEDQMKELKFKLVAYNVDRMIRNILNYLRVSY